MALSVVNNGHDCAPGAQRRKWALYGHDEELLGACSFKNVFATGSSDGVALLWRLVDDGAENVCKLSTGGPALLDMTFIQDRILVGALGDGSVAAWDAETGKNEYSVSRMKHKERCNWPVINAVTKSSDESMLIFGGDDGYLVICDARSRELRPINLKVPITTLSCTDDALFVGDVCGQIHWLDLRMPVKALEVIQCSKDVVTSIVHNGAADRLVAYAMDHTVSLWDTKPFALSTEDRRLAVIPVMQDGNRNLLRCDWSDKKDMAVFPTCAGDIACVSMGHVSAGAITRWAGSGDGTSNNFTLYVGDKFVLSGGTAQLVMREL